MKTGFVFKFLAMGNFVKKNLTRTLEDAGFFFAQQMKNLCVRACFCFSHYLRERCFADAAQECLRRWEACLKSAPHWPHLYGRMSECTRMRCRCHPSLKENDAEHSSQVNGRSFKCTALICLFKFPVVHAFFLIFWGRTEMGGGVLVLLVIWQKKYWRKWSSASHFDGVYFIKWLVRPVGLSGAQRTLFAESFFAQIAFERS